MDKYKKLLADAGRVLAHEGQGDYVAGHVSLRHPDDPNLFLMKPAGIGLEEMTDENIITVDIDDPISRVADLCIVHRVRRVPVMKDGRLVGIISRRDVLRALIESPTAICSA